MGNFTYAGRTDTHYMYGSANGNGRAALQMYHVQFHRITEFFSGYIVNFVKHVRSSSTGMMLVDEELAVSSPGLEESILSVMVDRSESNTRTVAHHANVPKEELTNPFGALLLLKEFVKNLELFFMNSVASTLNRVTGMEFNNQISVLTPNNWNTWKHDMQVLLMHYGCWQFIIQTKPEQTDEEATYKEKIRSTTSWKEEDFRVVKIEAELILEANRLQLMKQDLEKAENAYLSSFTSKKSKTLPGATAAAHGDPNGKNDYQKKGDLKPITNMKMSLATEDKSCPVEGIGTLRFRPDHYIIPKSKEISFFSDVTAKTKNGLIEIWHQRFCHVNNDYLVKTSKNDSVKGLPRLTDNGKTHCIPCKLAKSKRVSFKKTGAVRSKRPLELLHMDLCGPMPTESQGGNKYFLSIIDDYSRKVTVFPIRNKSDVFHTFIRFQKRAERFLSKRVIAVRTDMAD
ncbi:retrovirus-related Pol polyprotein from transposon TNT 1-94 [Trichonephila clavipes]|nr:retrovirus-related Pol polyprotein from transposon TNT 1-94 [Trichonephila clavipes]